MNDPRMADMPPPLPLDPLEPYDPGFPSVEAARRFYEVMRRRRSVRFFSDRPVARDVIEWVVRTGGSAPSGANKQPWRFVCVNDPAVKREIRAGAEAEERAFYARRASRQWLEDLAPLGTDWNKPFLETAPWLIAVFQLVKTDDGGMVYYREESVGIAVGFLLAAIHHAGLVALTHTPSPMGFLHSVLRRPAHERAFLLIPVGYPAADCRVPRLTKKPLEEIMVINRPEA